jgi:trehalose 6-phosphate synthase/phosphatase
VEEKDFSLVWHYRKVDPALGATRAGELTDELTNMITHSDLQVLGGEKVIEVKNAGINKGRAALRWIDGGEYDFILAIGDDWTDEDIFAVLPPDACSIRVGLKVTQAKYNLESYTNVLLLLSELL